MVSRETLVSYFVNLGCVFQDEDVIKKSLELCETYGMNEEIFVELWVAYSVPNFIEFEPTVETLTQLENAKLKNKKKKPFNEIKTDGSSSQHVCELSAQDVEDLLGDFDAVKPRTEKRHKRPRSPEVELKSRKVRVVEDAPVPSTSRFLEAAPVPSTSRFVGEVPSTSSLALSKPNCVAASVAEKKESRFKPRLTNSHGEESVISIEINKCDTPQIPKEVFYMFGTSLWEQGRPLTLANQSFGEKVCKMWQEKENRPHLYVRNVRCFDKKKYHTFGKISIIRSKTSNGRMVLLEGTKRMKHGRSASIVMLDLSGVKEYSIFPGQIVAVEGIMYNSNVLVVNDIFCQAYASIPKSPSLTKDLRVYVAAGPYTAYHSPDYQPLWNLIKSVKIEIPDILILIGPMVEAKHSGFNKKYELTFQEIFDRTVTQIIKELEGTPTKLIFVSSHRDAHHELIYPTIEYTMPEINKLSSKFSTLPDPCLFTVEDLLIGITAVDVIKDLSHCEITNMPPKDRLGRLADHVLSQRTFYPVYPTPVRCLNLDTTNWCKYATLEPQPHLLVLPSDIKQFSKIINGCLVLNPGRLFKGTFAKLEIPASQEGTWNADRTICEIAKFL